MFIIKTVIKKQKEKYISYNVRVYAMFAGCIISRSGTASKYGCSEEEVRRRTEPHTRCYMMCRTSFVDGSYVSVLPKRTTSSALIASVATHKKP